MRRGEALMRAASEEAGHRLSDAGLVGALPLLSGKVIGSVACRRRLALAPHAAFIIDHFTRTAKAEFAGRNPTLL